MEGGRETAGDEYTHTWDVVWQNERQTIKLKDKGDKEREREANYR